MKSMEFTLSDGREVLCEEYFACDNDVFIGSEAGEWIDVYDKETDELLGYMKGSLDEEEDTEMLIKKIEEML